MDADARPARPSAPLGAQAPPAAAVHRRRPPGHHRPPTHPLLGPPLALDRRDHHGLHPAPGPAEPRLTSETIHPDEQQNAPGAVEPDAHPTRKPGRQHAHHRPDKPKRPTEGADRSSRKVRLLARGISSRGVNFGQLLDRVRLRRVPPMSLEVYTAVLHARRETAEHVASSDSWPATPPRSSSARASRAATAETGELACSFRH